ncbi:MAG: shikimate dehydrogenase [Polyangiaceae bacterium]|nr:shikimate dehydrogenase [Polyangiaceae bacterium]
MSASPYRSPTKKFGLIGHPVSHSVSPAMMRAAFEALGLPHTYDAVDVPTQEGVRRCAAELRNAERAGWNVTIPHKGAACAVADEVGDGARRALAANVLLRRPDGRVVAENTDTDAIVHAVDPMLGARRWALILGSGGAARAALVACEKLGFKGVEISSRSWTTPEAAWDLGADLPEVRCKVELSPWIREWGEPNVLPGREADLVIQATSAGMAGKDSGLEVTQHIPWEMLPRRAVLFDVVYTPRVTPFLAAAHQHGLIAVDGLVMLVEQAALALKLWLGIEAPRDVMRRAAEDALSSRGSAWQR